MPEPEWIQEEAEHDAKLIEHERVLGAARDEVLPIVNIKW